jgi:hypothetical protein
MTRARPAPKWARPCTGCWRGCGCRSASGR